MITATGRRLLAETETGRRLLAERRTAVMYKVVDAHTGQMLMIAPMLTLRAAFGLHHEGVVRVERETKGHGECVLYLSRSNLYIAGVEVVSIKVTEAEAIELT